MKSAPAIMFPLLVVFLTGCAGVIPLPPPRHQPVYGKVISPAEVKFIVPGQTTRTEVIAGLGDQFRDLPRQPVLAYSWEKPAIRWVWWIFIVGNDAAGGGGGCYENSWHAFFVRFDAHDQVAAAQFVSLSQNRTLDEQLEDWAAPKRHGILSGGALVFDPDTGVPRVFEWMRENGQFRAVSN
jgi:hypothetical protein